MLTLGELQETPERCDELEGDDLLVAASGVGEVLVREVKHGREATLIFQHETIQIMKAERIEAIDKLMTAVGPTSAVVPLRKKPESLWDNITVGRATTADVVIDDPAISSVHAHFAIDFSDGTVSVEDVGSSNGTFVNRRQLQPHTPTTIRAGDCLRFGQTVFYYVSSSMLADLINKHATPAA
jgi:hypothetical protein